MDMKKLLVLVDVPNWAFDKIYHGLKNNLDEWDVHVRYGKVVEVFEDSTEFDVVLNLLDWMPELLLASSIPKDKLVMAIRSNSYEKGLGFYDNPKALESRVGAFVVANEKQLEVFNTLHSNVHLAPGGVNADFFAPIPMVHKEKLVVGWAGSRDNFGYEYRGLDIVESACQQVGFEFRPAYREDKWRTEAEMLMYYQREIDIYVDMSIAAGRQNGLLEAASCGKMLISTRVGIAEQLINHGKSGFLTERSVEGLVTCLNRCRESDQDLGEQAREAVLRNWSWGAQAKLFEQALNSVLENS